ncbi:uncharacterized protein LOC144129787 [Amblyomma americanum]
MLRKLSLHGAMSKARGTAEAPRGRAKLEVRDSLHNRSGNERATDSNQLSVAVAPPDYGDSSTERGSEDYSQIASLLQTLSSLSNTGKMRQTVGQRKTQASMVLPDIPEKISLEDWSVKACCIEDIVYPSVRNCSYLTNSAFAAFSDQASRAGGSRSSLFESSFTDSSSTLSLSAEPQRGARDRKLRHDQRHEARAAGLQCRRNENPDILVLLGGTRFPCHRALLSVHSQYFQQILAANPQTQKESCAPCRQSLFVPAASRQFCAALRTLRQWSILSA